MSNVKPPDADLSPLASAYAVGGLAALALFGLVLVNTTDRLALVPTLIGAAGLAFRWRTGPLLFIASVAIGLTYLTAVHDRPWTPPWVSLASDMALAASGLCYVIAHYRLIGLTSGVMPPSPEEALEQSPRRAESAGNAECMSALVAAVTATGAAVLLWMGLKRTMPPWNAIPLHWRLGLLAWILIGGFGVAAAVLSHLGWRRISRTEAAMFLQDALWHETRREQRRINRWRVWGMRQR
jgi:hypothetical protein